MKILLLVKDASFSETLTEALTDQGYTVYAVCNSKAAWNQLRDTHYDLMLLDILFPKLDGVNFCRNLRSHGYCLPIFLMTEPDIGVNKMIGWGAGADEYFLKPFDLQSLNARIRAYWRNQVPLSPFPA
ncbi:MULTISPECIES: response regulator transcription factor [unclassified Coleofasciculus]|uniref:response regulator transcription factor n=1 Tax=unclassified Coleofasciculus TaxID=2692782 RepID=UPI001881529A|nr:MULTISPECIES: response regulator transcription factor [unclassified Coleofasciculus]MBE9127845.1 response regulator transcription factor [Coleofasciculus sp. LEGE 07081]MBE9148089.1 response regulator transcription factor [Coleofasciculus sp. LEGE 07092]